MKVLNNALMCLLALTVSFGLFSCSSDDDETPTPVEKTANAVAGQYSGYHKMVAVYFPQGMFVDGESLTVTEKTDTTVTVVYNTDSWDCTLTDVVVKKTADGYTLSGEGTMNMSGMSGNKSEYACLLEGTISSDKSSVALTYTLPAVMQGTTITFINGEAPAANMIADTYTGYNIMSSQYFTNMYGINDTIQISANDDGTVTVAYNLASESHHSMSASLTNVTVTSTADGYTLSGEGTVAMSMSGNSKDYACTFTGTISKDKESCVLTFTLPSVMGGTTIEFHKGEVPAANYLADTYEGWSKMVMQYMPNGITNDGDKAVLTANEDGTVTVAYTSTAYGSCSITATVAKDGDNYTLTGEGTMLMGMTAGQEKEYACQLAGTISSDKATYSISLTLPSVMGGTTITFQNGTAPSSAK